MRDIEFRGRLCEGIRGAGTWLFWGISGTDMIDVIDTDTIGQYTGLKDNNDIKIYEGDIFKWDGEYEAGTFVVIFDSGAFAAGQPLCLSWRINHKESSIGNGEVIGNIHDNPDLV